MKKKAKTHGRYAIKRRQLASRHISSGHAKLRHRPLHKRFVLHPITLLLLLCVGVLLASVTINSMAASYSVTARLPAPPLNSPAIITYPADGTVLQVQAITVLGTCPQNSYVNLSNNGQFVGTDVCSANGTFQIGIQLVKGSNQLQAQDFNITDDPGPTSPPVTVTFNPPNLSPSLSPGPSPVAVPMTLEVLSMYSLISGLHPTFVGIAPPFSIVSVVVHSKVYPCTTRANHWGYWACTLSMTLPPGIHTVYITARTPQGKILKLPPFTIRIVVAGPLSVPRAGMQFRLHSGYSYRTYLVGQRVEFSITINGGVPPYALSVDWGDGHNSTYVFKAAGTFTIGHTYGWINAPRAVKIVKLQVVDSAGAVQNLQFSVVLRNPGYHVASTNKTRPGWWQRSLSNVRQWLWLLWPGYTIVLLLVFSFWLGERQEFMELMSRRRRNKRRIHPQH